MNLRSLKERLEALCAEAVPLAGAGETAKRFARLMEVGREDLTLAKLVEAHWDAVAILAEAGRKPVAGLIYGVWAADVPGMSVALSRNAGDWTLSGRKGFCSGSICVDRALVLVSRPERQLVDLDLNANADAIEFDGSFWQTAAFAATKTANATLNDAVVRENDLVGGAEWYLSRPGFWHGALGPAACWAGGATGLLDDARLQKRNDAHTLAHLGAMEAAVWAMRAYLGVAGAEIDADGKGEIEAQRRALTVRHLVEQACTDVLRRFARAYGPYPLAANEETSRRYMELDLYLRQSHAERDLESLGRVKRDDRADCMIADR